MLGIFLMALQFVLMFFTYLCVYMSRSTLGGSGPHRGQKRVSQPLELELQKVASPLWVLGAKLGPLEEHLVS